VQVIIDVGAPALELSNRQVVAAWLTLVPATDVGATVCFVERNDLARARPESFRGCARRPLPAGGRVSRVSGRSAHAQQGPAAAAQNTALP
jgi:hypothetical protein